MKAKDVMKTPVVSVKKDATLFEVARLLDEKKISGAPVVDDDGQLVGIISELDLIRRSQELTVSSYRDPLTWISPYTSIEDLASFRQGLCEIGGNLVQEVMTRRVVTVDEDDSLEQAAKIMAKRRINRIPVLRDGRVVGIITRGDLVWAMGNLCERKPGVFK